MNLIIVSRCLASRLNPTQINSNYDSGAWFRLDWAVTFRMRQIFYVSDSVIGLDRDKLDSLMVQSMRRNGLNGITGLLWTDGDRFAQILEGDDDSVDATLLRIWADARHSDVRMVSAATVDRRYFGGWAMYRPASDPLGAKLDATAIERLSTMNTSAAASFIDVVLNSVARKADV